MIDNLIQVLDGNIWTNSRLVAEKFNKNHKDVIRVIDRLIADIEDSAILRCPHGKQDLTGAKLRPLKFFKKTEYVDAHYQNRPMYLMNRDGFSLLAMGFTGKEALRWKLKYIEAFNAMEEKLHSTPQQLPDSRLEVAKLIAKTPVNNLPAIKELYPEYFPKQSFDNAIDRESALLIGMTRWVDSMTITMDWIDRTPTTNIYLTYSEYCKENHIPVMGKKTFFKAMCDEYGFIRTQRSDGFRYFVRVK